MIRRLILVMILCLSIQPYSFALLPPEVPSFRSSEIFASFEFAFQDNGESVFQDGGPACLGYDLAPNLDLEQTVPPSHGVVDAAGLPQFQTVLENPAGLLLLDTHGNPTAIAVEAFTADSQGHTDANTQLGTYIGNDHSLANYLFVTNVVKGSGQYWVIAAKAIYVQYLAGSSLATLHSIVYATDCNSIGLAGSFINGNHDIRNYLGMNGLCLTGGLVGKLGMANTGLRIGQDVFNNMSGISNGVNQFYGNVPISAAANVAQYDPLVSIILRPDQGNDTTETTNSILALKSDPDPPVAGNMRLYSAPRKVYEDISQDVVGNGSYSKPIYEYAYGKKYPYEPGTDYPGTPSVNQPAQQDQGRAASRRLWKLS